MSDTVTVSIDSAGRLVIPKAVRKQLGLEPGVPIELTVREDHVELAPATREVRLERRGGLVVAVPLEPSTALRNDDVEETRKTLRGRPHRSTGR